MTADKQTYARATSTALLGLAFQVVMGLALLIYAFVAQDRPAFTGASFILVGSAVWLILAILFDQHRRERLEALEEDALAASGHSSSAFGEAAQELRVAAKRLAWMHRILIPVLSLVVALALAGLGVLFFVLQRGYVNIPFSDRHFGWAMAIGIALAVVGFVFARYVAGMAKNAAWSNLRGGAAFSVAASLVGAAIAISHFALYAGWDVPVRYLHVILPIAMMVIALEIVLNFLLGLYRPRVAGEIPRPAFDSRILAFVAAPDRLAESVGGALNYQFGFNVTDSWFYQLISRWLAALLFVGLLVVWAMTSLAIVQPNEQGLLLRFGRVISPTLQPGIHRKAPWPIDVLETIDATTVRPVQLGADSPKVTRSILWTNEHGVKEVYFAVQPSTVEQNASANNPEDGKVIRDLALVSAEIPLYYVVNDYSKFRELVAPELRDQFLRAIGRREVLEYLATQSVDGVLGVSRPEISAELTRRINGRLAELNNGAGAGVTISYIGLVGVHPPRETAAMFESVVQSNQSRAANIQSAKSFAESQLIAVAGSVTRANEIVSIIDRIQAKTESFKALPAGSPQGAALQAEIAELERTAVSQISASSGSAADLLTTARAARWETHMTSRARAERFMAQVGAYRAAPAVYQSQLYFQTLAEIMANTRVYIVVDDDKKLEMRLNLEESLLGNNLFDAPKALGTDN